MQMPTMPQPQARRPGQPPADPKQAALRRAVTEIQSLLQQALQLDAVAVQFQNTTARVGSDSMLAEANAKLAALVNPAAYPVNPEG